MRSTLSAGSQLNAPSSPLSTSTHPLTLKLRDPLNNIQTYLGHTSPSMPTGSEDRTSEYLLTVEDMEGDLNITVRKDELDEKGRLLIDLVKPLEWVLPNAEVYEEWEEDEEDQDVDFIDLYESDKEDNNSSEDSDEIYSEEMIYEEEVKEEEYSDNDGDYHNDDDYSDDRERERSSDTHSRSKNHDVDMIGAENCFWTSPQEIGQRLLGRAMTLKDFFISPEDQQDPIEHIITKRKWLFAGNAGLIIDLDVAAKEDAEEHGIDLEEMDRIDREMDR
ncbi:hypothetical protein B9Z19DRAFT_1063619 [Tuber borchii]|uniref:Uncharacterized protein n=1 Tax=Tuber borchii TaxID=42251 RepID=A0A2T6ZXI9_TUBBO|nr:hypothetical protein B9Z19DRAFT_1063619 [Tuber borchii]